MLEFLTTYAIARRAEQLDRIGPRHERRTGIVQDRSGGGVHVMAARSANVGPAVSKLVVRAVFSALGANKARATEANGHNVFKARIIGRVPSKEPANAEFWGCEGAALRHPPLLADRSTCV